MTSGDMDRTVNYLRFEELADYPSDKTRAWTVWKSSDKYCRLGVVKWYGPWRQYVFFPDESTVFNKGCMLDIIAFIDEAMADWRKAKADVCSECNGAGEYYTEWSASAEADPELKKLVTAYPPEPDGTVWIRCVKCNPLVEGAST